MRSRAICCRKISLCSVSNCNSPTVAWAISRRREKSGLLRGPSTCPQTCARPVKRGSPARWAISSRFNRLVVRVKSPSSNRRITPSRKKREVPPMRTNDGFKMRYNPRRAPARTCRESRRIFPRRECHNFTVPAPLSRLTSQRLNQKFNSPLRFVGMGAISNTFNCTFRNFSSA